MAEQQSAVKFVGARDGISGIARRIFLRRAHVTFGVDGVVEAPVGGSGHGYTGFKHTAAFAHAHQRVETTEAPAPNADTTSIHIGLLGQPQRCFHLVARL